MFDWMKKILQGFLRYIMVCFSPDVDFCLYEPERSILTPVELLLLLAVLDPRIMRPGESDRYFDLGEEGYVNAQVTASYVKVSLTGSSKELLVREYIRLTWADRAILDRCVEKYLGDMNSIPEINLVL